MPLNWRESALSELPTGTVTLLLADVEGSTRLWENHHDMAAANRLVTLTHQQSIRLQRQSSLINRTWLAGFS